MACKYRHKRRHSERRSCQHDGFIKRTIRALAERFDVPKSWVITGFVLGFLISAKLTLLVFLVAWLWSENPQKVEAAWHGLRNFVGNSGPTPAGATATGGGSGPEPRAKTVDEIHRDPFLRDLQRQFDDLEKRTAGVERHVTSEEYSLNNEFKKMRE